MQTVEALKIKHAAELAKIEEEMQAVQALPDIPGVILKFVHSKLYEIRHFAFELQDYTAFIKYMNDNALDVFGFRDRYAGFYPIKPDTIYWVNAKIEAQGKCVVRTHSSIKYQSDSRIDFFIKNKNDEIVRVSITLISSQYLRHKDTQHTALNRQLWPIGIRRNDISHPRLTDRPMQGYAKTNAGQHQYLRHDVDKQGAELETLCTLEQLIEYWKPIV